MTRIRPSRFWSVLAPVAMLALSIFGVFRMLQTGQPASQFALVAPFLVGSAVLLLYFGWLYYVEFDDRAVHQTKYFGFGDKHFDVESVTHVFLSAESNVFMMRVAAVNIRAGRDEIRLLKTAYSRDGLAKLVTALKTAGAPIDAAVLHELGLSNGHVSRFGG